MDITNDEEPLLPTKSNRGIETFIRWFFTAIFVGILFGLIVVAIQFAERTGTALPAPQDIRPESPIDLGADGN